MTDLNIGTGTMKEYTISSKQRRNKKSDAVFIYGIVCPISNELFYIGRTSNPRERLETHLFNHEYMIELSSHEQEYTIRMIILEEVAPSDNPDERETFWILKTLERGIKLRNKAYPMAINSKWIAWIVQICDKYGWDSQITHNNRVRFLPLYEVR